MTSSAPAMGTQSPDDTTVSPQCNTAVCQTAPLLQVAASRTLVNASTTGTYRTNHQAVRVGADDNKQHKSYGVLT